MKCYSHNDENRKKELKEHLEEVKTSSSFLHKSLILELASYFHDIGKANDWFQRERIREDIKNIRKWEYFNENEHSLPSALFILKNFRLNEETFKASWLISSHHIGLIKGINNLVKSINNPEKLEKYFKDLKKIEEKECVREITEKLKYESENKDAYGLFSSYDQLKKSIIKSDLFYLFSEQYKLLSYLILCDRFSAADLIDKKGNLVKDLIENKIILPQPIEYYLKKIEEILYDEDKKEINAWRSDIQKEILKSYDKNIDIYLIDVPTGGGKTIASLLLALKIAKEEGKRRVIYMLPYVSIIDQTYESIKKLNCYIFDNKLILDLRHHLAIEKREAESKKRDIGEFIGDIWDADIIITTYVQFWDMVVMFSKGGNIKIPFLQNSIIVLDEIQYINYRYNKIFRESLKNMLRLYNSKLIITTATSPLDEKSIEKSKRLPEKRIEKVTSDRTKIKYIGNINDINELAKRVIEKKKEKDKIMVILNTIDSSFSAYEKIRESYENKEDIYYLSGIVIPKFRNEVIKNFDKKGGILVSTQSVEAGVDLDSDAAFREIAPLDSLIQIAGRVNRNGLKELGIVYVFEHDDSLKTANYLYGTPTISLTKEIIQNNNEIPETNYSSITKIYWDKLLNYKTEKHKDTFDSYIKELKEALKTGNGTLENFKLIKKEEENRMKDQIIFVFNNIEEKISEFIKLKEELKSLDYNKKLKTIREMKRIRTMIENYSINYDINKLGANDLEKGPFGDNSYLVKEGTTEWEALYDENIKGLRISKLKGVNII